MKNFLFYTTALATAFIYANSSFAISGTCNDDGSCTWSLDDEGILTVNGNIKTYSTNDSDNVVGQYPWYNNRGSISKLKITNATSIPGWAFFNYNIQEIELPEGLTSIGRGTFYGTKFTNVALPSTLTYIGMGAFQGSKINSVIVPESVTDVTYVAFGTGSLKEAFCSKKQIENGICASGNFNRIPLGYYEYNSKTAERIYYSPDGQGGYQEVKRENLCKDITLSTGAVLTIDPEGKVRKMSGKKIYTIEEAEEATKNGTKFHVGLTYK